MSNKKETVRYTEARWLRHGRPLPEGWRYADNEHMMRDHHNSYGRIIVRDVEEIENDGQ